MSSTAPPQLDAALSILRCPSCSGRLAPEQEGTPALACADCGRTFPVRDGIARFVDVPADDLARRTQASFGYEWTHFDDWQASGATNFQDYFAGIDLTALRDADVLDAGCGMGRHARQLALHCRRLVAIDFSRAIDAAARNVAGQPNVTCVQADLTRLPLAECAFDFVYSMGVVHHLSNTEEAIGSLVRRLRPGGRLRLYLYWKRRGWSGRLLRLVDLARHVTIRLPFPVLRAICFALSLVLWGLVIVPYRGLLALGVRAVERWPLVVYTKYPFTVLYNDQFDRFSAPLEKRYSEEDARRLLEGAGLRAVTTRPMYGWLVDGIR